MYKLIGTDGKEYGPATADQIRQWIRENRVDRHTRVFVHDAADWTPACLLPEFATDFPAAPPPPLSAPTPGLITPPVPLLNRSLAKTGLICGILSVTVCCCCGGLPFNVLGLVFSIIALVQTGENPQRYGGRDLAIMGLILSALGFLMLALTLVFR